MKTHSDRKLDTYLLLGDKLRIRFNEVISTKDDMGEQREVYEYDEAVCHKDDTRDMIVERIIGTVYSTGAEFACINNGGEDYEEYQSFRQLAKNLADGWFEES